jgi:hypothetical protein
MGAAQLRGSATAEEDVVYWRLEQLLRGGYESEHAYELAGRRDVDLHQALRLLRDGCPADLALAILL